MSVKDINGVELEVGQVVVSNPPYLKGLTKGIIIKVTPKGATIVEDIHYSEAGKAWYYYPVYNRQADWICVLGVEQDA